ncbi:hypothetical protein [Streptomyces sp. G-G2]|uniref:hypothetical protein n=1 Tax=Streptomyces sp. G-G2 TaxID=3046201 RepID=UPI0024B92F61|nr:hypothetical protein [Streptomyces sp. G-G2]MDJ0384298.1 hypothetical protein [Streptomyces sp. G-G2]
MGSGPAPRGAQAACAAALMAAALPGCSGPAPGAGPAAPGTRTAAHAPTAAPAPRTTAPEDLCTSLITHWAGVLLDADEPADERTGPPDGGAPDGTPDPTPDGGPPDGGHGGHDPVGLDYQSMGLSGGQNEILRAVLADARTERRAQGPAAGPDAAHRLTAREARSRCAERYRSGTPTGGPWQ